MKAWTLASIKLEDCRKSAPSFWLTSGSIEAVIFRAPVVVGPNGVRALGGTALSALERSPRYRQIETTVAGVDIMRRYVRV